jgi:hypothetical protein
MDARTQQTVEPNTERTRWTDDELAKLLGPMNEQVGKAARTMAIAFLLLGASGPVFLLVAQAGAPRAELDELINLMCTTFFFAGVLPAVVLRWIIRRDIRLAPKLVRDGERYPARITSHTRNSIGGMHELVVEWEADGKQLGAHFDIAALEATLSPDIVILARPRSKTVGVIVNERLYLGIRNLRDRLRSRRSR